MSIKMICVDLDGTLYGKRHCISNRTRQVIQKAQAKGIEVVITTGRIFVSAVQVRESLKINCPIISSNGGIIVAQDLKTEIYKGSFGREECLKIIELIQKYKVTAHFYTKDKIIANNLKGLLLALGYKYRNSHNKYKVKVSASFNSAMLTKRIDIYDNQIVKCVLYSRYKGRIKQIISEVKNSNFFKICGAGKNSAEVTSKDVSKGKAVEILMKQLKLNKGEVMAIGDNENDILMIQNAGIGIAMGNAIEKVKEIADYVTDTNINDGVAKAIEKYVLQTK